MRHGWVYLYEFPPAPTRFQELVDQLSLDGISLADPGTGQVIRLSPTGEQISSSKQDILRECANSSDVSFNLYIAPSDHLFASIFKLSDEILREGYSLDGKAEEQSQRVIKNLTQLFSNRAENRVAFGFVADEYAELHRDFHWDDFFAGTTDSPPEWPSIIGCSTNFAKVGLIPESLYSRNVAHTHILFNRRAGGAPLKK